MLIKKTIGFVFDILIHKLNKIINSYICNYLHSRIDQILKTMENKTRLATPETSVVYLVNNSWHLEITF